VAVLWYKTWCESRARLALTATLVGAACVLSVGWLGAVDPGEVQRRVMSAAYGDSVKSVFLLATITLGAGSLLQERPLGTLGLTLSLPVSRARLLFTRAAVGMAQVWLLVLGLVVLVALLTAVAGHGWPWRSSLGVGVLWGVCGGVFFAISLLAASLIPSEHLAWSCAFFAIMGYELAINGSALRARPHFDLFRLMSGELEGTSSVGTLPWTPLLVIAAVSVAMILASALRLGRREL
jgi:ABC-2 type transport system permease protein